jgi:hypothetical protein
MKVQDIDPEMVVLIQRITETAVIRTRIEDGKLKPYMSLREAEEAYGADHVSAWRKAGLIQCLKDGERNSKIRIDRFKIATVAASSQRGFSKISKNIKK